MVYTFYAIRTRAVGMHFLSRRISPDKPFVLYTGIIRTALTYYGFICDASHVLAGLKWNKNRFDLGICNRKGKSYCMVNIKVKNTLCMI